MTLYTTDNIKDNDSDTSGKSTIPELEQEIAQLKANQRHRERIQKLKSGEIDAEELDVIPFYCPADWESREQYERLVEDKVEVFR